MANLPEELINEILLWLPVKSLIRFRCVSKSFCAIIASQSFISSHFKRSFENNIHRKLIDLGTLTIDNDRLRVQALEFNHDFEQEMVLDKLFPSKSYPFSFSYCNGLVLLCIDKLSIWNPSTRQYRILPPFPVKYTRNLNFSLGYDKTTDDYKVVVIMTNKEEGYSKVWIFELRSNCWRRIQDFPYVGYGSVEDGSKGDCFVDGDLHFMCYHRDGHKSFKIVAFDVAKETFSIVEPVHQTGGVSIRLHVFLGCLSISFWSSIIGLAPSVDIYVRQKDGDTFTWTRLYFLTPEQDCWEVFGYFAEGTVAYSTEGDNVFLSSYGKLYSCDFKEKSLQEITTTNTNSLHIFTCTESLASIGSSDE